MSATMSQGMGKGVSLDVLFQRGMDLYKTYKYADDQADIKKAEYQSQVEIEQARTKKLLYLGIGLIGAAFAFTVIRRAMR